MKKLTLAIVLVLALVALGWSLTPRPAEASRTTSLDSIGALAFSPSGALFVADSLQGRIFAFELDEEAGEPRDLELEGLNLRVASLLGTRAERIQIHDLAISPVSSDAYLSVTRGQPVRDARIKSPAVEGRSPHLLRLDADGALSEVDLPGIASTSVRLEDVRDGGTNRWGQDRRAWSILELKYLDGTLFVSGMSNEEWSSKIRRLRYPFEGAAESSALRIFHTAHGRWETDAPARVFTPYLAADGEKGILAGFSCTPLVEIPLSDLETRAQVEGKTIAELGPGNHVLDMITVSNAGRTHFLLANHLHPFMSLALDELDEAARLTRPTARAGIARHPLAPTDVTRLANLGADRVVMLREVEDSGRVDLSTARVSDLLGGV